jgi:hypothetical protein
MLAGIDRLSVLRLMYTIRFLCSWAGVNLTAAYFQ